MLSIQIPDLPSDITMSLCQFSARQLEGKQVIGRGSAKSNGFEGPIPVKTSFPDFIDSQGVAKKT
jgi:hypothetical protein